MRKVITFGVHVILTFLGLFVVAWVISTVQSHGGFFSLAAQWRRGVSLAAEWLAIGCLCITGLLSLLSLWLLFAEAWIAAAKAWDRENARVDAELAGAEAKATADEDETLGRADYSSAISTLKGALGFLIAGYLIGRMAGMWG